MFKFNIQEEKPQASAVDFGDLDIGDTFMYYVAYEDAGLDTSYNLIFIKSTQNSAICINGLGSQRGFAHCIAPDTKMIEVDLGVTNIKIKEEK